MYWTNGGGERVWCVGLQVFMLCRVLQDIALVGFWKKTSKISFEKFGSNEKVLTFAAAFRNEADVLKHFDWCVFHLLRMKPAEAFFYGGSEKKFEKKCGKIWREYVKVFIFASAFASWVGRVKEKQKEFLKILKGLKQTASASPRINSTDIMTERKR